MPQVDETLEGQRRLLDAFLVDNDELETLNARLKSFNIFNVLKIAQAEIRHSNVLSWLLDPSETHGLGPVAIRRFLSRLLLENDSVDVSLTPAQVELMNLSGVEVYREWQNIDILVHSRPDKWCLIIENKIGSKESKGQLAKYKDIVTQEFPDCEVVPVLLTLEGEDPSEEGLEAGYVALSHTQVLDVVARAVEQNRSQVPHDAAVLIDHYLSTLRRLTMQDEELVGLCKAIYSKHREAIELIVQYGASSRVLETCEAVVPQLTDPAILLTHANRVWFVPREMAAAQAGASDQVTTWPFLQTPFPIVWWFYYHRKRNKLVLCMEVGRLTDPDVRIRLMNELKEAGFSFWEKGAFRREAKYTRILSDRKNLRTSEDGEPDDSEEHVREVAEALWKKCWAEGSKVVEVLREFDWSAR